VKNASNEIADPDIEIVVRAGLREVAIIGIFAAGDTTWDVIVGIDEADTRASICSSLQLALDAVSRANFSPVRSVGGDLGRTDHPPA